jgi:hypothetical protein
VTASRADYAMLGTWGYPWPAWEALPTESGEKVDQDLFIGSLRLAAVREALEDYEYFQLARKLADRERPDAQGNVVTEGLLEQLQTLIDESQTRIHKFRYYDVDPAKYHQLRRQIGDRLSRCQSLEHDG